MYEASKRGGFTGISVLVVGEVENVIDGHGVVVGEFYQDFSGHVVLAGLVFTVPRLRHSQNFRHLRLIEPLFLPKLPYSFIHPQYTSFFQNIAKIIINNLFQIIDI